MFTRGTTATTLAGLDPYRVAGALEIAETSASGAAQAPTQTDSPMSLPP
jgi:hypothetical protein